MPFNIGYVFDEGFAVPAAVSIYSLLYNNRHIKDICLYILDDGIAAESRKKIEKIAQDFERRITFIDVSEIKNILSATTKFNWNGSYATYIRLMLNHIFPEMSGRLLMIDGDTIINGRIDYLASYDMKGNVLAAAHEAITYRYRISSGLGCSQLVNGGLLLFDLDKWKSMDMDTRIIDYLQNVRQKNMLTDEDVLSVLLKGKTELIDARFNFLSQYYVFNSRFYYKFFGWDRLNRNGAFYSYDELQMARHKPVILHCIDTFTNRPWHKNNIHPYTKLFDRYLSRTPWKGYTKPERKMAFLQTVEYTLRKYLPKRLSVFMAACGIFLYYGIGAKMYYSKKV